MRAGPARPVSQGEPLGTLGDIGRCSQRHREDERVNGVLGAPIVTHPWAVTVEWSTALEVFMLRPDVPLPSTGRGLGPSAWGPACDRRRACVLVAVEVDRRDHGTPAAPRRPVVVVP